MLPKSNLWVGVMELQLEWGYLSPVFRYSPFLTGEIVELAETLYMAIRPKWNLSRQVSISHQGSNVSLPSYH